MRNQSIFLDFTSNASLAQALADKNPGDKVTLEMVVTVKTKDDQGMTGDIDPGTVVPEGFEPEEPEQGETTDPTAGADMQGTVPSMPPVMVAMGLKKKGEGQ